MNCPPAGRGGGGAGEYAAYAEERAEDDTPRRVERAVGNGGSYAFESLGRLRTGAGAGGGGTTAIFCDAYGAFPTEVEYGEFAAYVAGGVAGEYGLYADCEEVDGTTGGTA